MPYAILAYHVEAEVMSWTSEQDAALMGKLVKAHERINENSGLGPTARLGETGRALTLRKGTVIDGPFAETKEQLLGFYLVDCKNLDEALDVARDLGAANPGGAYEIRPVGVLNPGSLPT